MEDNEQKKKIAIAAMMLALEAEKLEFSENIDNKRSKWTKQWLQRTELGSYNQIFKELSKEEKKDFSNYVRMPLEIFHMLLMKVTPLIKKEDTHLRESIPPGARLEATLRYVSV